MMDGPAGGALAARLDAVESRIAITELVYLYARNVRRGLGADNADLFVAGGTFEMQRGSPRAEGVAYRRLEGRAAIRDHMAAQHVALLPLIHNLMITLDGDYATGTSALVSTMLGTSGRVMAEYRDTYRREDGTWRFVERISQMFDDAEPPSP